MSVRSRTLPPGWYPAGRSQTVERIEGFLARLPGLAEAVWAGVVPHAGWEFSGRIACRVLACVPANAETVVVVGGHLLPGEGILAAFEEGYETPLGVIEADLELLSRLRGELQIEEDRSADNTVEVQLPLIKHLLPRARALGLRASPSEEALRLGETLAECAWRLKKKVAVIGSTDLTHYGANYGFTPQGSGRKALDWVRGVNDRRLVDALLALDLPNALELARRERSACSVGGAAAAARFAQKRGTAGGKLLEYATSHDVYPGSSFVGYAGIIYPGGG